MILNIENTTVTAASPQINLVLANMPLLQELSLDQLHCHSSASISNYLLLVTQTKSDKNEILQQYKGDQS